MSARKVAVFILPVCLLLFLLFVGGFFGPIEGPGTDVPQNIAESLPRNNDSKLISENDIRTIVGQHVDTKDSLVELDVRQLGKNRFAVEIKCVVDLQDTKAFTKEQVLSDARDIMTELFRADNIHEVVLVGRLVLDSHDEADKGQIYRIKGTREKLGKVSLKDLDLQEFEEHLDEIWIHERLDVGQNNS